jgi:hypothetical protein
VDVDTHFLREGWEDDCVKDLGDNDVLAGKGVPEKPIRPACMFMKTEISRKYDWRSTSGYRGHRITPDGFDVGISAYYSMIKDGVKLKFMNAVKSRYPTLNGEEWCSANRPFLYHHWHGTHLKNRQVDFPNNDLMMDKQILLRSIPWRIANNSL